MNDYYIDPKNFEALAVELFVRKLLLVINIFNSVVFVNISSNKLIF